MSNYKSTFLQRSTTIHGKRYNYDQLPDCFSYADWIPIGCSVHGIFIQKARTHATGGGCQRCAKVQREIASYAKSRLTKDEFVTKAKLVHGERYDYSNTAYNGQMKKLTVKCPLHGDFSVVANNHIHGTGCSKCKRSRGETLIQTWLDRHDIKYESQKTFSDLALPDCKRLTNRPKYDFYIPSHNVLIEFDGKQHFEPVRFRGVDGVEAERLHKRTVLADTIKTEYAKQHGYRLIRIPYTDITKIDATLEHLLFQH